MDVAEDLVIIMAGGGTLIINYLFSIRYLEWNQLLQDLVDFSSWGEQSNFSHTAKQNNRFSLVALAYSVVGCSVFGVAGYREKTICLKVKTDRQLTGLLCGMYTPIWLPFSTSKLLTVCIYLTQFISCTISVVGGTMVCVLTWHSAEIISLHFENLTLQFRNIIDFKNEDCKTQIVQWIQHHNRIIK